MATIPPLPKTNLFTSDSIAMGKYMRTEESNAKAAKHNQTHLLRKPKKLTATSQLFQDCLI